MPACPSRITPGLLRGWPASINGLLIVWLRIPPFIATLAMMSAVKGFSYIIQSTSLIQIIDQAFIDTFSRGIDPRHAQPGADLPRRHRRRRLRRQVHDVRTLASTRSAATPKRRGCPGCRSARNLLITYTMSGLLAGLAGLIAAAQLRQGSSLIGAATNSTPSPPSSWAARRSWAARAIPISAVIGVFVLATIINIMNLVGISSEPQLVIKGAVIIIAVFLSSAGGVRRISGFFSQFAGAVASWRAQVASAPQLDSLQRIERRTVPRAASNERSARMIDVARLAGVSQQTVSRVVNNARQRDARRCASGSRSPSDASAIGAIRSARALPPGARMNLGIVSYRTRPVRAVVGPDRHRRRGARRRATRPAW